MSAPAARRTHEAASPDSLSTYLQEIRAYPLLTREQEVALAQRIHAGDEDALDQLVCSNLRFVVSVAKKYQHRGVALADLINEANLGLIRAAEKFDETKGVKFISYAVWWIRQAIMQALAEHSHPVRVPVGRAGMIHRVGRHANSLRHELGREPTQKELAAEVDCTEAEIESAMAVARPYLSLDAPSPAHEEGQLMDVLSDDAAPAPDDDVFEQGLTETVETAMTNLRGREAQVLRLYFGLDGNDPMTLEDIGGQLGITRERVRQIKEKALSRIRRSAHGRALATFCTH